MDLQKAVKSNAEEVSSFLSDLSSWSQDMRAKELAESIPLDELEKGWESMCAAEAPAGKPSKATKTLTDAAKKSEDKVGSDKAKKEPPRRGDYMAWEKYNAEEALKKLEEKRQASLPEEEIIRRKAIEMRTKKVANDRKESGNQCIKDKNYARAIEFYTDGIKLDDKNTILYANRAQAYLYLEEYEKAKDDCDRALRLDSTYVKAVFRRAKSYIGLGLIENAKTDLKLTLSLDPRSSEAIQILNGLMAKNKKIPPAVTVVKPSTSKSAYSPMAKPSPSSGQRSAPMPMPFDSEIRERTVRRFTKSQPHQGDGDTESSTPIFPRFIQPISKPEHEQSNAPLVSIPITIVGGAPPIPAVPTSDVDVETRIEDTAKKLKVEVKVGQDEPSVRSFTAPVTTIEFYRVWHGIKDSPQQCASYLEKFSPNTFKIFAEISMDCATFSEILQVLQSEFLLKDKDYSIHLEGLSFINRVEILILFLSEEEKRNLNELITNCTKSSVRELDAYKDFKN